MATRGKRAGAARRMSASEIARLVGGELVGDADAVVTGAAGIESAGEGDVTLAAGARFDEAVGATRASVVVLPPGAAVPDGLTAVRVESPEAAFCTILEELYPPRRHPEGVAERAVVDPSAELAASASVRPGAVVDSGARVGARTVISSGCFVGPDVTIGEDCLLHPGVVLYEGVSLGDRVIVGANTVIGSDGFGFIPGERSHRKIPQVGTVVVEDDVEIGSCCCIDRARLDVTVIGRGTKIDNLVQVAHNVELGRLCLVAAQAGFAGSASVGESTMVGGQAGISGHLRVGSRVRISGQAGVTKGVPDGVRVTGFPAVEHRRWLEAARLARKLPRLAAQVEELKARLDEIERHADDAGRGD